MRSEACELGQLPRDQQRIRDKCRHPTGTFLAFQQAALEASIPGGFEEQVHRDPHRLAVKTNTYGLTYDAFNGMANRIAHAVVARRGIGAEPVVLLFDPDAPLLAAIIGVLKAGKSYVPLEPALPPARTPAMLEDLQPGLIITDRQHYSAASLESPTVADMAAVITQGLATQTEREDVERALAELEALADAQALRLLADETQRSDPSGA